MKRRLTVILAITLLLSVFCLSTLTKNARAAENVINTVSASPMVDALMEKATSFIVARHYQMGGSQYSYTWSLNDESDHGPADMPAWVNDPVFLPGSQMVRVELKKEGDQVTVSETVLIDSPDGVVRDPEVSTDGTRLLFSWKKDLRDEFHLYEMDLQTQEITQLTFGSGAADIEPKYLPDGRILFCSTRVVQTVDCWYASPANIFVCDGDGSNIIRITYDQVSLTYPTVTEDGRVLYTRWEYNDKSAMYAQGIFQMNPDGTNQTEVYGNNKSFITSLLHTRQIPGSGGKYLAIASGHHTKQAGKLVIVDTNKGRNSKEAITFINPDDDCLLINEIDEYGQKGALYKFPYPISEDLFLVTHAPKGWEQSYYQTPFGIYLMNTDGEGIELIPSGTYPASQVTPIMNRTLFNRASTVDYTQDSGIYYVSDVYQGEAMEGIERGTVKALRVVSLTYRAYSIGGNEAFGSGTASMFSPISTGNGAWDVKTVLGVVPVEEDGSAMFRVPSETPVYFQLLDKDGCVVQTMRSWSTLMPGELYSCVGCHKDKNTTPSASGKVTLAMQKGVQELKPDVWQDESDLTGSTGGFDYLTEIQPILDSSCVRCHTDKGEAYDDINMQLETKQKYTDNPSVPVSLKGELLAGDREKKAYPLSYLVLTQSWLTYNDYYYWTTHPEKNYLTTWYAAESRVELFKPYTYGSKNSKLIQMLREGHGNLSEEEICAFEAWVDLGVPAFGRYDAHALWDDDDRRKAEEETNKRNYYDMLDMVAKRARAGISIDGEVSIRYDAVSGGSFSAAGREMALLNVPQQLAAGDKVTVTLPEGTKYLMFTLSSRMGEALIYVPDGVFTYTVPDLTEAYPTRVATYPSNNIVARVPTEEELTQTRNLALNPYDADGSNAYPHVTASGSAGNQAYFQPRNAVDGFTANGGSGKYPCQSWEAASGTGATFQVDFGRTVTLERMDIRFRAADGDAKVTGLVLEFDNGETRTVTLTNTTEMQSVSFKKVSASSVTIREIRLTGGGKLALSEVQFFGTESN